MQLAERPRATGSIALWAVSLAVAALALAAPQAGRHHHVRRRHHHRVRFDMPRCRDHIAPPAPVVEPAPVAPVAPAANGALSPPVTTYDGVLAEATPLFAPCFATDGRPTELLVTIAPDGRVRATTSRPEPETHTSQCLGAVVRGLVFPPAPTTIVMRLPLAPGTVSTKATYDP